MTFNDFFKNNRPTIAFILSFLFSIICLITKIPYHIKTLRSFLIYFLYFQYIPIYQVIDYPLTTINKFVKISYLYEENIKLRKKILKDYLKELQKKEILKQNLRNIEIENLNLKYNFIDSRVIFRDYTSWYDSCLVLTENSQQNEIQLDSPVILNVDFDKFYFVGRVWSIEKNIIKVLLVTNSLSSVPVKVKNKTTEGVLIGNSSIYLTMDYILPEDDIRINDIIVTSGINNIPEGFEIGKVVEVETPPGGFKKATVKPTFNINSFKNLLILTSKK